MKGIDSDLIRGHVDTIILKILFEGDKYGYEICKEVEEKSNKAYVLKQPTLYSCLKRLESQNLIASYWEDSTIGGRRHYYKLTELGRETFLKNQQQWLHSRSIIDSLISDVYSPQTTPHENKQTTDNQTETNHKKDDATTDNTDNTVSVEEQFEDTLSGEVLNKEPENENTSEIKDDSSFNNAEEEDKDQEDKDDESDNEDNEDDDDKDEDDDNEEDDDDDKDEEDEDDDDDDDKDEDDDDGEDDDEDDNDDDKEKEEIKTSPTVYNIDESHLLQSDMFDKNNSFENDLKEFYISSNKIDIVSRPIEKDKTEELFSEGKKSEEKEFDTSKEVSEEKFDIKNFISNKNNSYFAKSNSVPKTDYVAGLKQTATLLDMEKNTSLITDQTYENEYEFLDEDEDINKNKYSPVRDIDDDDDDKNDNDDLGHNNYAQDAAKDDASYEETETKTEEINKSSVKDDSNSVETVKSSSFSDIISETRIQIDNDSKNITDRKQNFSAYSRKYTDTDYKEILDRLANYSSVQPGGAQKQTSEESKITLSSVDFSRLKSEFEKDGIQIKPHYRRIKAANSPKNYFLVNRLKMVRSWLSLCFMSFLIAITYLVCSNIGILKNSFTENYLYFVSGFGVVFIIALGYTFAFLQNKHKKQTAKYAPRASILFSILFTVQFLVIIYAINLQNGLNIFTQTDYNHLNWIIPAVVSLIFIVNAVLHYILYSSKKFHA